MFVFLRTIPFSHSQNSPLVLFVIVLCFATPLVAPQCFTSSFQNTRVEVRRHSQGKNFDYINKCIDGSYDNRKEKITELICENSKVDRLKFGAVQNLTGLRVAKFINNGLLGVDPKAFMSLGRLEKMVISDNRIEVVLKHVFNHLPLEEIDLSDNSIKFVQNGAFANMPRLRLLTLSRNAILEWEGSYFTNSPNIFWLDLSKNHIQSIPDGAFRNLDKLKHLHLQKNRICNIEPKAFEGSFQLEELNLADNLLKDIDPNTVAVRFGRRRVLNSLFLERNQLMFLPRKFLASLENVNYFRKFGNPWTCRCNQLLLKTARDYGVKILKKNGSYPECVNSKRRRERNECVEEVDEEARRDYYEDVDFDYTEERCPLFHTIEEDA